MPKKLKLKENMDLIQIYQNGQWEEFLLEYEVYCKEIRELDNLIYEFKDDYFIEYNLYPIITERSYELYKKKYIELTGDNVNVDSDEWNVRFNKWREEYIYKLFNSNRPLYKELLGDNYKSPTNVMNDNRLDRLDYLAKKWLVNNKNSKKSYQSTYLDSSIPLDSERLEFAEKYFVKKPLSVEFDNTIEEVEDYGYTEIIKFAEKHLKRSRDFFGEYTLYKYLAKKLKRLRLNANLSIEELSDKLQLSDKDLKNIESDGNRIDLELLIKYANIFDIKLDDIVAHNYIMEKLIRRQKEEEEFLKNLIQRCSHNNDSEEV